MIQYTFRRLSKRTKGGQIIIALLGNESGAVTPGAIEITTVIGNFGNVADFVAQMAIENSRSAGTVTAEVTELTVAAGHQPNLATSPAPTN
jgi:hypothetical protein